MSAQLLFAVLFAFTAGAALDPHVGFVYPAGTPAGSIVTVTVGGQFLKEYTGVHFSGVNIAVEQLDYLRIYDRPEINQVRRTKEFLDIRMEEEKDPAVIQQVERQLELNAIEQRMIQNVQAENRRNPKLAAKKQFNPQISEQLMLKFSIPENTVPGDYEFRIITKSGLSNPLLFRVSNLPEFDELEPNDLIMQAEELESVPVIINGQIMPGDVDCFKFFAAKGQTLVLQMDARALMPYLADTVPGWFQAELTLYDSSGNEVAFKDDFRFDPDPVLIYKIPVSGEYTVTVNDAMFRGREDFVYRLTIAETPFIESVFPLGGCEGETTEVKLSGVNLPADKILITAGSGSAPDIQQIHLGQSNRRMFRVDALPEVFEKEPNDTSGAAQAVPARCVVNGLISESGDVDVYSFTGVKGEKKTVEVMARRLGSPLDSRLMLLDTGGKILALNDDSMDRTSALLTHHADSRIDTVLPADGMYYLRIEDVQNKGGAEFAYRLMIGEAQPDYQLRIVPASIKIPAGGSAIVDVHAIRSGGFNGKIELALKDAPDGMSIQRAAIPEGVDKVQMLIAASSNAVRQITALQVEGTGKAGVRTLRRTALAAEDMMQAFYYRHLVPSGSFMVQISDPEPVTVALRLPLERRYAVKPGTKIEIPAATRWQTDVARRGIRIILSDPPEWLTLDTVNLGGGGGKIVLSVSRNAEPKDRTTIRLSGSVNIPLPSDHPDYNPVMKARNNQPYEFAIDAIPLEITE
ncbi:MAG: PPC domain-containing protein [Kiritimatiellales bacterium]